MSKPKVFLGSSGKAVEVVRAVARAGGLVAVSEPLVWDDDLFQLSGTLFDQLYQSLSRFDFAVLALCPDDDVVAEGEVRKVTRDNVLFECGLFMGNLGRERTFIVSPKGMELPDDLKGILYVEYDGDLPVEESLRPGVERIAKAILRMGPLRSEVDQKLDTLRSEVEALNFLLLNFLTQDEKAHLRNLDNDRSRFSYVRRDSFKEELLRLVRLGLIERNWPLHGIRSAWADGGPDNDLREHFHITKKGKDYLARLATIPVED